MLCCIEKSDYLCKLIMRKILYILFVFITLSVVMSCSRSVDKRLVLADTLMWINPDSSLAILNAINRYSLQGDENLAYHALLLTQAQFRCNIPLTSETLISKAVDYYSDNHNREHYTRALLYKGGAYEDMGNPVEAIKWYKQAENNADSTDYRNLAQINFRMGKLYYINYASNNLDLEKFKKALKYYKILKDERMIMISLSHIGNIYRASNVTEAIKYLNEAKKIALEINDTASYYNQLNELSMAYYFDSLYIEAKDAAIDCINNVDETTNAMLFNAANAYSELNMPDSALFYLKQTSIDNTNQYDRMMYAFALSKIYKAQNQESDYLKYDKLGNSISDSITLQSGRNQIFAVEDKMDSSFKISKQERISYMRIILFSVSIVVFLITFAYISNVWFLRRKFKKLLKNTEENKRLTKTMLDDYKSINSKHSSDDNALIINYLQDHFSSLNQLIEKSSELAYKDFLNFFNKNALKTGNNENFWKSSRMLADERSGNLVTELENNSHLTESELRVISLICLGYKNDAIAACTGTNKDSVKSKKTRIKNKIRTSMQLDSFIMQEIRKRV